MNILEEADNLINGERAQDYGDVSENFDRIAQMWGAYRGQYFDRHDVAQMMILVKVARQASGYHRDSNVDIAGYAALDEQVHDAFEVVELDVPESDWFFTEFFTSPATPRVWESLRSEVPIHVSVTDKDGDTWKWDARNGWRCWMGEFPNDGIQDPQSYSPFTEVLED